MLLPRAASPKTKRRIISFSCCYYRFFCWKRKWHLSNFGPSMRELFVPINKKGNYGQSSTKGNLVFSSRLSIPTPNSQPLVELVEGHSSLITNAGKSGGILYITLNKKGELYTIFLQIPSNNFFQSMDFFFTRGISSRRLRGARLRP